MEIGVRARPQYLRGLTGERQETDAGVVVVFLVAPLGKFNPGHVRCTVEPLAPLAT